MTSEPVGHARRSTPDGLAGNSHKQREVATTQSRPAPPPNERLEKVLEGTATMRKQPWYKRAKRSIIAEDAGSVGAFLFESVLIPGLKTLAAQAVGQGTNRILFGTRVNPQQMVGTGVQQVMGSTSSLRTQYSTISSGNMDAQTRELSRQARATNNFEDIVFETHNQAAFIIQKCQERIAEYGACTVVNLFDFCGISTDYTGNAWGWRELNTAGVHTIPGGFILDMPRPQLLNR